MIVDVPSSAKSSSGRRSRANNENSLKCQRGIMETAWKTGNGKYKSVCKELVELDKANNTGTYEEAVRKSREMEPKVRFSLARYPELNKNRDALKIKILRCAQHIRNYKYNTTACGGNAYTRKVTKDTIEASSYRGLVEKIKSIEGLAKERQGQVDKLKKKILEEQKEAQEKLEALYNRLTKAQGAKTVTLDGRSVVVEGARERNNNIPRPRDFEDGALIQSMVARKKKSNDAGNISVVTESLAENLAEELINDGITLAELNGIGQQILLGTNYENVFDAELGDDILSGIFDMYKN